MDYFNICLDVFPLTMQGIMHLIFTSRLTKTSLKLWHFAAYLFLLHLLGFLFSVFSVAAIPSIGAELLILYAVVHLLSKKQPMVSFAASTLALYSSQLSFGMINALESLILPYFLGKPYFYLLLFLSVLAACTLCALCYMLLLRNLSFKEKEDTLYIELLLFPVLFFFAAELYIIQTSYTTVVVLPLADSFAYTGKHLLLLLLQALGLGALFCTQYAYQRTCHSFQTQAELVCLTQAANAQKTYIAEARMRDEQTRAFRHDIKNHLSVLNGLLNAQEIKAAQNYLEKLNAVSSSLSSPCQTGNPTVDILLGEKLELAKAQGISTDISLLLPANDRIDDFDLCIIFSNALDNAINACLSIDKTSPAPCTNKETAPFICITGEQQGDFYLLEFKNSCSPQPHSPMGTGLSNIRFVALKYHGAMQTETDGQCFCLHVLLNIC